MSTSTQVSTLHTDILELLDVESTGASAGRFSETLLNRRITEAQGRLHQLLSGLGWSDWLTYWVAVEVRQPNDVPVLAIPLQFSAAAGASDDAVSWWQLGGSADATFAESVYVPSKDDSPLNAPGVFCVRSVRILESYTQEVSADTWAPILVWSGKSRLLQECPAEEQFDDITARDWTYEDPPRYRVQGSNTIIFDRKSEADAGFLIEYTASAVSVATADYLQLQPMWARYLVADAVAELAERDREYALADRQRSKLAQYEMEIREAASRRHAAPKRIRDDQSLDRGYGLSDHELRDRLTFGRWWP